MLITFPEAHSVEGTAVLRADSVNIHSSEARATAVLTYRESYRCPAVSSGSIRKQSPALSRNYCDCSFSIRSAAVLGLAIRPLLGGVYEDRL